MDNQTEVTQEVWSELCWNILGGQQKVFKEPNQESVGELTL